MTRFAELLRTPAAADVEFIVVGGAAAMAHGAARGAQVIEMVYRRAPENLKRLVEALGPFHPYLRGTPEGLPFRFDIGTLAAGLNFTLTTDLGWIDLFGEIAGGGRYEDLAAHAIAIEVFGTQCRVLDLEALIRTKRAAGRLRDLEAVAELESIRKRSGGG